MSCVTHHSACDCREDYFAQLEIELAHWQKKFADLEIRRASCCVQHEEALLGIKKILDTLYWHENIKRAVLKVGKDN